MFLFLLFKKEERKGLHFSIKYLKNIVLQENCALLARGTLGMIAPNKTPTFMLHLLRKIKSENFFGLYNILIAKINKSK